MKQHIYSLISFFIILGIGSCSIDKFDEPVPTAGDISYSITPSADNPNIIDFANKTSESTAYWDFGNGASGKGNALTSEYALEGVYHITLTVFKGGGQVTILDSVIIEQTDASLLDREDYNYLTGGGSNLEGKNWVFDKLTAGHMKLINPDNLEEIWWSAAENEKDGWGVYDDTINFNLNGFKFNLTNGGDTFVKDYVIDEFKAMGATVIQENQFEAQMAIDFDEATQADWGWSITTEEGVSYLSFSNGAFPSWHVGGTQKYEIITLNDDELIIRSADINGLWEMVFLREGYTRPIVEKPLEANDIYNLFSGQPNSANVNFVPEGAVNVIDSLMNFDKVGNTNELITLYERTDAAGDNGWIQNINVELEHRLDLSTRNQFVMKVYFLASNDYTTVTPAAETAPWLNQDKALENTVALRLEDSKLGNNGWQTRAESKITIGEDDMGRWIEVTFDFSAENTRTDFDKIIIQIGGEGHTRPGNFYISDFRLL